MKMKMIGWCAAVMVLAGTLCVRAGEQPQAKPSSPEFEQMKSLVGTWAGKVDMGEGPVEMTLQYRLSAAGNVLEERCLVGTPNEMVTMYFEEDGKLALTHYCVMGNRPGMVLQASDDKKLRFDFDDNCGPEGAKEPHMHALSLQFVDSDTITTSCKAVLDGKVVEQAAATFKRVDS